MSHPPPLSDEALLDRIQRGTLEYFFEFAHPVSGMARERDAGAFGYPADETVTTGGTGFGIMALIAGTERGLLPRPDVVGQIDRIVRFLGQADRFRGVFPHFLEGSSGRTVPFSPLDDGGDLVETSFLMMGLLSARQWLQADHPRLAGDIDALWRAVEWRSHLREDGALLWHWSPRHGNAIGLAIEGWNECLVTHVLAAASPTHPVSPSTYHESWARGRDFRNGREHHAICLPLGPDGGGPLFFAHYSFLGLDPRGLVDVYADYFEQNVAHVMANRAHCLANPHGYKGYGPGCWGLTASDDPDGYAAHQPTADNGVISPTAALSSFPYAPAEAMRVARHLHDDRGDRLWGPRGFADAFAPSTGWVAPSRLAIDQGPIVVMIENHRSGLLWNLFMSAPEVQTALCRLGFSSPHLVQAAVA
jgi:hypothetical protein